MLRLMDFFLNNFLRTYEKIRKIETGQGDDYTTGCLLGYDYLKNYYKIIAICCSTRCWLGNNTANQFYCKSK